MKYGLRMHGWYSRIPGYLVVATVGLLIAVFFLASSTSALTTVPTKMNFQGRLTDSSGNIMPNGTYNMRLKLYTVSTAGSAVWSEDRLVSATQGVTVTNGLFSIKLGDITTLPASLFASGELYLEVELPSPATATSASPTWSEGPMTPRNQMATSAYAYNAETLDGIDGAAFGQLSQNNTWSGTNTFSGSLQGNGMDTSSASALTFGSTNATAINLNQNATILAGKTLTVGTSTNGVILADTGLTLAGTARGTKTVTLVPEYQGATFRGDGTDNTGNLSSDFCSATTGGLSINTTVCSASNQEHNYYEWANTQATAQDYDLYVRYQLPADYSTGSMTNLTFTAHGSTTTEAATLTMHYAGTQCATSGDVVTSAGTWQTGTVASPLGSCTPAANNYVIFMIQLSATQNNQVRAGAIGFTYRSTF